MTAILSAQYQVGMNNDPRCKPRNGATFKGACDNQRQPHVGSSISLKQSLGDGEGVNKSRLATGQRGALRSRRRYARIDLIYGKFGMLCPVLRAQEHSVDVLFVLKWLVTRQELDTESNFEEYCMSHLPVPRGEVRLRSLWERGPPGQSTDERSQGHGGKTSNWLWRLASQTVAERDDSF